MQNKLRRILQKQDGIAILLVLCLGALFVALAAALGYAASVLTANANSQLREQQAYQLAVSFSDVLEKELKDETSEFADFINGTYMNSVAYGTNIYTQESGKTVIKSREKENDEAGADKLTLTLQRRPGTEADDLTADIPIPYSDAENLAETLSEMESPTHTVKDLELDITVKAEKDGVSYAYTVNYVRDAHYNVYYTLDNNDATHYRWDATGKKFYVSRIYVSRIDEEGVKVTDTNKPQVTLHYNTTQTPTDVTYTRGVRSQKGAT